MFLASFTYTVQTPVIIIPLDLSQLQSNTIFNPSQTIAQEQTNYPNHKNNILSNTINNGNAFNDSSSTDEVNEIKSLTHNNKLKDNINVNQNRSHLPAEQCVQITNKQKDLNNFSNIHLNETVNKTKNQNINYLYKCSFCTKEYKRKTNLENHLKIHLNTCFKCNICSQKFIRQSNLKKHKASHYIEKLFKCRFCHKHFKHRSILLDHIRRHTGEKPFQCDICFKSFSLKQNLKVHKRIHDRKKTG
eukprot:273770_1